MLAKNLPPVREVSDMVDRNMKVQRSPSGFDPYVKYANLFILGNVETWTGPISAPRLTSVVSE